VNSYCTSLSGAHLLTIGLQFRNQSEHLVGNHLSASFLVSLQGAKRLIEVEGKGILIQL
jgi:hypothetical protein